MMERQQPILETEHLKKYFKVNAGMLHAVDDISVSILPQTTLGVVGESGCGKSTLGRTILKLLEPTDGSIRFEGRDITNLSARQMREMRMKMQIIFQDPFSSINPRMTVAEIIAEYMLFHKMYSSKSEVWKRTSELMDTVGLARRLANAYPHELDGGRRQRIGIARALSVNPKFIVCDEPVSALDVSIQAQILNMLLTLQKEFGLTYLFITHDLSVVKHISDDIMVMYLGQCVEKAPAEELFRNPVHPYTKALLSAIPVPDISMRDREIIPIKGEVKSPVNPAPGCRFAGRCEYACEKCTSAEYSLELVGENHYCSCIRAKEVGTLV